MKKNFNEAVTAALGWLSQHKVSLDESFETKFGRYGMRSADRSGGYRVEHDNKANAHINVWCHETKGPHFQFPGNEATVKSIWRQLFLTDPKFKKPKQDD